MKKILLIITALVLTFPTIAFAEEDGTVVDNGSTMIPVGTVSVYAGIESNTQLKSRGYLIADGSSVLRSEYSELFAVIGTTYGAVDSTHFNLPNLTGRTVVGQDESDSDFKTLGQKGGEKTVKLTIDQIPAHTHTFIGSASTTSVESNSHTHTFNGNTSQNGIHSHEFTTGGRSIVIDNTDGSNALAEMGFATSATGWWAGSPKTTAVSGTSGIATAGLHTHTFNGTTSDVSTTHTHTVTPTGTNASTGGGEAHNNLQPYIALKYIIKVK